jgi:hypothetical protein
MRFFHKFKKQEINETLTLYKKCFGNPTRTYKCKWFGKSIECSAENIQLTNKNVFYVLEFSPQKGRTVWAYVTLSVSRKTMINGMKSELIWLNEDKNLEIQELLVGLAHLPFITETCFDYGHTISNAENKSDFKLNILLVCPPIIEAGESRDLMKYFEN